MSHVTTADGVTMARMGGLSEGLARVSGVCSLSLTGHPCAPVSGWAGKGHARSASGGGLRFPGHPEERLRPTRALLASLSPEHLPYDVSKESHVFNPEVITCFLVLFFFPTFLLLLAFTSCEGASEIERNGVVISLVVQWLRLHTPNTGGLGSIPGQGIGPNMPQLRWKTPQATAKTQHSQTNNK